MIQERKKTELGGYAALKSLLNTYVRYHCGLGFRGIYWQSVNIHFFIVVGSLIPTSYFCVYTVDYLPSPEPILGIQETYQLQDAHSMKILICCFIASSTANHQI